MRDAGSAGPDHITSGTSLADQHPPAADMRFPIPDSHPPILVTPSPPLRVAHEEPASYEQALVLYKQGANGEAAEQLAVVLSRNRDDARALALLCRIRANEGKLTEALQLAERALNADKLNAGLHYLRAIILQEQGTLDDAVKALKQALYLDRDMVIAHFALGNLTLRQKKEKESRKHFNHALTLLTNYRPDDFLPGSEGILAGRLMEIIRSTAVCT